MKSLRFSDWWTLKKTASYYVMHITVAALVAYAVTGSWRSAVALSLIEPTVQAAAYYFHEKAWQKAEHRAPGTPVRVSSPWASINRLRRRFRRTGGQPPR